MRIGSLSIVLLTMILLSAPACAQRLPDCEWCGAQDAPKQGLTSVMVIADEDEPGERLILRGQVFKRDGRTPASGVLMYAYHTDITGVYRRDGGETGNGLRHGVLRGWLMTDDQGRYEIRTIKPAPYPSRTEAAHVHVTLTPPGGDEDWLHSFLFEGDPLITRRERRDAGEGRFSNIVQLEPRDDGSLVGERDLRIGAR